MTKPTPSFVSGALPLVGHTLEFQRDSVKLDQRGRAEHGDVFAFKMMGKNVAVITGAEYNKIFYTETDKSLNINDVYGFLKATFGEVLFIASKEKYLNQRPLLQAIFSRQKMAEYVEAMQLEVQRWLDSLGDAGETDISADMLTLTRHVAGRAFVGPDYEAELGEAFWRDYDDISRSIDPVLPATWPLPKFIRRDRARERIIAALKPVIAKRRQNPEQYNDLITQVLAQPEKDGNPATDEDIVRLFMGLLFAGHETTAGQAAWTVIQLLQHPDYLRLVQDEIDAVLAPGQAVDGGVLRNLEHVYWAIDETTRLKPSAPMQMRIVEQDLDLGDVVVPAGWLIKVSAATSHHNEAAFADNEHYDPLRFAPGRDEGKNTFNIIGFGGGMHKCTGMNFAKNEMAVVVALLFQQFDVELVTQDPHVVTGLGANHASATILRYRRKGRGETVLAGQDAVVV